MRRFCSARVPALALGLVSSCNSAYVDEQVPTDICASGKRWIGGLTPSEEMYPGHDCVDCHRDYGGPELILGGTIYGLPDPDGARTTRHDCFGVEGAQIIVTGADGQVLRTRSNRAGNFFFEGREASLAKPFTVTVEYTSPDGTQTSEPMNTKPSYGGCARCHTPGHSQPTGADPGTILAPEDVVDPAYIYPIYTGPVDE